MGLGAGSLFGVQNPTDRGAWWATVHRVAESQTQLTNTLFYVAKN